MGTVQEVLALFGDDEPLRILTRDEAQLLSPPHPNPMPIKLWRDHPPLTVVHFPQQYEAQPFAPPRGVYESAHVRVEWQTMDNRQPFYHRNCDVDEISYQIDGERTLMTELGVVEHRRGEFSRLPRGVAHDNWGRKESHLLFYTPAPVGETAPAVRTSEPVMPPFLGWQPGALNEAVTQCLGTPGHDITVSPIDEKLLLEQVKSETARLQVLRAKPGVEVSWLYRSDSFRLGVVRQTVSSPRIYRRTLDADEIQYQVSGHRTLISQRGIVELGPGDFIRIPLGVAHASAAPAESEHISLFANHELPQIAQTTRTADPYSPQRLAAVEGTKA
ncbi:hypothetical protein AB0K00_46045 [Dactylosporangium sp. NPDC049525]|uniref:hypothetical protein n=1 Tax=Dactylosporangium sp. NPDC049525 TaxID=3154730 RepID=UPI00342D7DD7